MATALEDVAKLTVRSLTRGFNQAAVLICEHAVKVDSAEVLAENTEVTYTDPDLGFVFSGRVTDISELWTDGEGVIYTCADSFRTMTKEPAILDGSTKLRVESEFSGKTFLTTLLDEFIESGGPLASYDITDMEDVDIEPIDMAGQSLFEWINRILAQTTDTVCWIEYDVSDDPVLMFKKYSDQPDLELAEGDYDVVDPDTDDNPLIVNANIGKSLDEKYSRLHLEGCGHFKRWDLRYVPPVSWTKPNPAVPLYVYRFDVPETWATGRYLDADGNCRDDMWVRIGMGHTAGTVVIGQLSYDLHNISTKVDEVTGVHYWELTIFAGGVIGTDPPPIPQIQAWFTYTAYVEALVEERVGPLVDEGAFVQQYPDLFWYEGSPSVDLRSVLSDIADRLESRYLDEADRSGNVNVHIKGLDPDVVLGAKIIAPVELADPRLRGIRYDLVDRTMTLDVADAPLRPEIKDAQMKARLLSEIGGNWYTSKEEEEPSCFCGGDVFVDEDGNTQPNTGGAGGGEKPGPSWECIQGTCVEFDDDQGQYKTLADCERECTVQGWDFVPCTGCVATEFWAEYETLAECEAANPDPFDPAFSCGSGSSQAAPGSPGESYEGRSWEASGCGCVGGGGYFLGFLKSVEVDKGGRVVRAETQQCNLDTISGWTGSVQLLCGYSVAVDFASSAVFLHSYYTDLVYSEGVLISVIPIDSQCDARVQVGATTRNVLLADCISS